MNALSFTQIPSQVRTGMERARAISTVLSAARDGVAKPDPAATKRITTLLSLCARSRGPGTQAVREIERMARDGCGPNRVQAGRYIADSILHEVLDVEAAIYRATDARPVARAGDALLGQTTGKQLVAPHPEVIGEPKAAAWELLAPVSIAPDFGAVTMLLPTVTMSGSPTVGRHHSVEVPRISGAGSEPNRTIGYFMIETVGDPWEAAQAARGNININALYTARARQELRTAMALAVYEGESKLGWSSALTGYGTPEDSTTVKVDGSVADLVAGVQAEINAFNAGAADKYFANYCLLSTKIMNALKGGYSASGQSMSGIEFLRKANPEITFEDTNILDGLNQSPITTGDSVMVVGYRQSNGAGAPLQGMQLLADTSPTLYTYDEGLNTITLFVVGCAGTFSPSNDLTRVVRFDTVT